MRANVERNDFVWRSIYHIRCGNVQRVCRDRQRIDGALFEVHGDGEDSNALSVSEPFIRRPFCELDDVEEGQTVPEQKAEEETCCNFWWRSFLPIPSVIDPSNQMAGQMPGGANNQFAAPERVVMLSPFFRDGERECSRRLCSDEALRDIESSIYWKDNRGAISSSTNGGNGFTEQYESYVFAGDIRNANKNSEVSLKNALTLVALSPWLRENLGDGTLWKRINDPSRELEIKCYGFKVVSYEDQGDEIVHASNPRCENIQFYERACELIWWWYWV